jgi:hypothetical protein
MLKRINQFYKDHTDVIVAFELGACAAFGFVYFCNTKQKQDKVVGVKQLVDEKGIDHIMVILSSGAIIPFHKHPNKE